MSKEADPNSETRLISVNGKVYAVQIVPAELIFNHNANSHIIPEALSPSPLSPSPCAAPKALLARTTTVATTTQQFTEQVRLFLWLLAGISAIALLVAFMVRLFAPAAPLPLSPVPQTVIGVICTTPQKGIVHFETVKTQIAGCPTFTPSR